MHRTSALIASAAMVMALAGAAEAQSGGQKPPVGTEMPSTQHQQQVLAPAKNAKKGMPGQSTGNTATAPTAEGAAAAAPGGPCGTSTPATKHQQQARKTAQNCADQGGSGTTTGPNGAARTQPGNKPAQKQ
jgi:hypothetical protein